MTDADPPRYAFLVGTNAQSKDREPRRRLGRAIFLARSKRDVSGEAVAAELEVDASTYYAMERGDRHLTLERVHAIARYLDCDVAPLIAAWGAAEGRFELVVRGDGLADSVGAELAAAWPRLTRRQLAVLRFALGLAGEPA